MNKFFYFLSMCLVAAVILAVSCPSDQAIRSAYSEKISGYSFLSPLIASDYTLKIENMVIYKEMYSITGECVGVAIMGRVCIYQGVNRAQVEPINTGL